MTVTPAEPLDQPQAGRDGVGLAIDPDNVAATVKLIVDQLAEVGRDEHGTLRITLLQTSTSDKITDYEVGQVRRSGHLILWSQSFHQEVRNILRLPIVYRTYQSGEIR